MAKTAIPAKPDRMAAARAAKAAKRTQQNSHDGQDFEEAAPVQHQTKPAVKTRDGRSIPRRDMRPPVRKLVRRPESMRDDHGRVAALGRDGQMLSRKVTDTGDKFHVPKEIIPDGWTYQWITQEVIGQTQRTAHFYQNGWTPVPADRHAGMWTPEGFKGAISVEGLILVERPEVLTEDARDEEIGKARSLLRTQNDQFRPKLPGARSRPGTGLKAKRSIERMPDDIAPPDYEIEADPGLA